MCLVMNEHLFRPGRWHLPCLGDSRQELVPVPAMVPARA